MNELIHKMVFNKNVGKYKVITPFPVITKIKLGSTNITNESFAKIRTKVFPNIVKCGFYCKAKYHKSSHTCARKSFNILFNATFLQKLENANDIFL